MPLFVSKKKIDRLQLQVKALQASVTNNLSVRTLNDMTWYPDLRNVNAVNTYATSDLIYSVINKIAETSASVPLYPYLISEEKSFRQLKSLTNRQFYTTKGLFDIRMMQTKALEDAPGDDPLNRLLEKPNDYLSKQEFILANYIFYLLKGESFIYKLRLKEAANEGKIYQLHILPPDNVLIHATQEYPHTITGYDLKVKGQIVISNIPAEDIIHWKRLNPQEFLTGKPMRGLSQIDTLNAPLTRLAAGDTRSISQIKNGGVESMIFDETFDANQMEQSAFDAQAEAFYKFVNEPDNAGAPFFAGTKKGLLKIGSSLGDLKLLELQKVDFKRVCNAYKVSDILFNSDTAATESNVREQIVQMYTSACLPMVYSFRDKLNSDLIKNSESKKDFGDELSRFIDCDISHITELQDDLLAMMQAMWAGPGGFTLNEGRLLFGYDERDEDYMKQPLIRSGFNFDSDLSIPPIDTNLLDAANANDYTDLRKIVKMPA